MMKKMMMIQGKNSIMMILFTITMKMRIVTNDMCRKRSKFDARMSNQQDGLGVMTMATVLTKEMYKINRREQCTSKQNDDDKGKE